MAKKQNSRKRSRRRAADRHFRLAGIAFLLVVVLGIGYFLLEKAGFAPVLNYQAMPGLTSGETILFLLAGFGVLLYAGLLITDRVRGGK